MSAPLGQLRLIGGGPLAAAAGLVLPEAEAPPSTPGGFLADLLDARASVLLADRLAELDEAMPPWAEETPPDAAQVERAVRRVRGEIREVEARLAAAWDDALKPRYRLPGPLRFRTVLEESGALATPGTVRRPSRPMKSAARTLWAPFGEFLDVQVKRARFDLRDLRRSVTRDIRAAGPSMHRLERLDAALDEATRPGREKLYRRLLHACEAAFERAVVDAVAALGAGPEPEAFSGVFGPDGAVGEAVDRGRAVAFALFEHDRRHLMSLLDAAVRATRGAHP